MQRRVHHLMKAHTNSQSYCKLVQPAESAESAGLTESVESTGSMESTGSEPARSVESTGPVELNQQLKTASDHEVPPAAKVTINNQQ